MKNLRLFINIQHQLAFEMYSGGTYTLYEGEEQHKNPQSFSNIVSMGLWHDQVVCDM